MATRSQSISKLVFRRNIPFKLETYVLNCEMLQVLVEMDGIKDVGAIAAKLNKTVGKLVNTFATLYQQKLIFLVNPKAAMGTEPPVKRPRASVKPPRGVPKRKTTLSSAETRRRDHYKPFVDGSMPEKNNPMPAVKPEPISLTVRVDEGPVKQEATEYFKNGLLYLQVNDYQNALRLFELTLELDPKNRLCRFYIQQIQKILQDGKIKGFKST